MQQLISQSVQQTSGDRLPFTSMPDRDWWEALWPHPDRTLTRLGLKPHMSILDLGCGYGYFTIPAARIVAPAPVVGIDIDSPILAQAQQASQDQRNCLWLNLNLLQISQSIQNKFDYIMMHSTFHGLMHPLELVQDVQNLLKPGGLFSVVNWLPIPKEETLWLGKQRGPKTELRMSPEQLLNMIRDAAEGPLQATQPVKLSPFHYGMTFQFSP